MSKKQNVKNPTAQEVRLSNVLADVLREVAERAPTLAGSLSFAHAAWAVLPYIDAGALLPNNVYMELYALPEEAAIARIDAYVKERLAYLSEREASYQEQMKHFRITQDKHEAVFRAARELAQKVGALSRGAHGL